MLPSLKQTMGFIDWAQRPKWSQPSTPPRASTDDIVPLVDYEVGPTDVGPPRTSDGQSAATRTQLVTVSGSRHGDRRRSDDHYSDRAESLCPVDVRSTAGRAEPVLPSWEPRV